MADNIITLYHGTTHEFDEIDVNRGKPYKDFGAGFYASRNKLHAESLAKRNKSIEIERLVVRGEKRAVNAWLCSYEFDLACLDKLNVKEFIEPGKKWVEFIVKNRTARNYRHGYDVVIGPTANDDTNITIQALINGVYGDPESDAAIDIFLQLIMPERLPKQMYFGTQKAAAMLKFIERTQVL